MPIVVSCVVCGQDESEPFIEALDWLHGSNERFCYVRCLNCGLVYIRERPNEDEISRYYPEKSYYTYQHGLEGIVSRPEHIRLAKKVTLLAGGPESFIDVGCGDGSFLASMRGNGWEGIGTELHDPSVKRLSSLGYQVFSGQLNTLNFTPNHFKMISMLEVIEHLHQPIEALSEVYRLLKTDGFLYITTPNIQSMEFRLYGSRWVSLEPPIHLQLFSIYTLSTLLRSVGFNRIEVWTSSNVAGLTRSLWLAARGQSRHSLEKMDARPVEFHEKSWRRSIHEALNMMFTPLGWAFRYGNVGAGLEAIAYRA